VAVSDEIEISNIFGSISIFSAIVGKAHRPIDGLSSFTAPGRR
jgi:hypothetical protein